MEENHQITHSTIETIEKEEANRAPIHYLNQIYTNNNKQ
jgi:hypothetical protein